MDVDTVSLFLALLALVAEAATAAALVLWIGGRVSPALRGFGRQAADGVGPSALALAAVVAAVCTAGSLYFSEVAHFPPCRLCWYQRIAMYPLVPLLGIAAWRRDAGIWLYGTVIAALGAPISVYHILLERDIVHESGACDPSNPCNIIWVKRLGYLTIPAMALSGFALIVTLLAVSRAGDRLRPSEQPRSEVHG